MNIGIITARMVESLRRDGFVPTLRKAFVHLTYGQSKDFAFDEKFGTDTAGFIPLWEMKIESANAVHGHHYRATEEEEVVDALASIAEDRENFVFVDLGCGKGRVLLIAARFGFKSVVGVEFAAALADRARANVAKLGLRDVTVIHADASTYVFPPDDLIIYLYNSFGAEILRKVVKDLAGQLRAFPNKKIYVVYKTPVWSNVIDESAAFDHVGAVPGHDDILVWRARPRNNI